jgi:hypothetical protein
VRGFEVPQIESAMYTISGQQPVLKRKRLKVMIVIVACSLAGNTVYIIGL